MSLKTILLILVLLMPIVSAKTTYNFYISGHSMNLPEGLNKVQSVSRNDNLTIGDIYCYRPDYRNFYIPFMWDVCHRLISINGDYLVFRGDNNGYDDPDVHRRYVHLKVLDGE